MRETKKEKALLAQANGIEIEFKKLITTNPEAKEILEWHQAFRSCKRPSEKPPPPSELVVAWSRFLRDELGLCSYSCSADPASSDIRPIFFLDDTDIAVQAKYFIILFYKALAKKEEVNKNHEKAE